jgi:hypothetical protein
MAGTRAGGQSAAKTNKLKYGADFYAKIGAKGGSISRGGGFSGEDGRLRAQAAGALGGRMSKRGAVPSARKCDYCAQTGHLRTDCKVMRRDLRIAQQRIQSRRVAV